MKRLLLILLFAPLFVDGQIITTIAGTGIAGYTGNMGAATIAQLNDPINVRFDNSGDLLIADAENNVIRKISSSGIITTIAGNGTGGHFGDGSPATNAEL